MPPAYDRAHERLINPHPSPEFRIGDPDIVTGDVCHTGECGIVVSLFQAKSARRSMRLNSRRVVGDFPANNFRSCRVMSMAAG